MRRGQSANGAPQANVMSCAVASSDCPAARSRIRGAQLSVHDKACIGTFCASMSNLHASADAPAFDTGSARVLETDIQLVIRQVGDSRSGPGLCQSDRVGELARVSCRNTGRPSSRGPAVRVDNGTSLSLSLPKEHRVCCANSGMMNLGLSSRPSWS